MSNTIRKYQSAEKYLRNFVRVINKLNSWQIFLLSHLIFWLNKKFISYLIVTHNIKNNLWGYLMIKSFNVNIRIKIEDDVMSLSQKYNWVN